MFICGSTAFFITASTAASISLKDDLDRTVELKQPAQRIVTLAPFLTELVFAAGAGDRVVGVSAYSDYPPEARALPVVSSSAGFDVERIAALKPDLVLVWRDSMRSEDVERIARFGAAVYVAHARELKDVPRALRAVGALTGRDTAPIVDAYQRKLDALRARYRDSPGTTAFLEIWHKPLTTIAGAHFMNEALEICGARNVFADLDAVAPVVQWEEVYRRDPAVVVGVSSAGSAAEFQANWREHATLSAVKAGRLVYSEGDPLQRITTRTPDAIGALCAEIARVTSASRQR